MMRVSISYLFHWPKIWPDNDRDTQCQETFIRSRFPEFKELMHEIVGRSISVQKCKSARVFEPVTDYRLVDLFKNLWDEQ